MIKIKLIVLFFCTLQVPCKLDTSTKSYTQIIMHLNDYYKCDFIISFGDTLTMSDRPWNQQGIFAKHNVRLKNLEKFKKAAKPLVVFFSDRIKFQLIASAVDASKPVFCFFMNVNVKVEDFFSNIYFPYQYKFIVSQRNETDPSQEIIWKVKLDNKKNQIVKLLFATWSEETGIQSYAKEFQPGYILRAGIFDNPPLSNVEKIENKFKVSGFLGKIAEELQDDMNFKFTYKLVHEVGVKENGTWSGGMGLLKNNSIDILFTPLFISLERSEDFDFSLPLLESDLAMFIKKTDNAFSWSSYFEPFNTTVWYIIILTIIIESIALIVFEYYKKIDVVRRLRRKLTKISIQYAYSFLRVYGAMCGQSLSASNFNPLRILQLTIHVTALLILIFYSAVFLSIITAPQFKPPITSFKDLIEDNRYKVGCIRGQPWNIFKNSEDEVMRKIFHKHIKTQNPIPISLSEGHERMCKDGKYAFITFDNLAYSYLSSGCILLLVEKLSESQLGIAFQHNSPYIKAFNNHLLKMVENGLLKKIEHKYLPSSLEITDSWVPITELAILSVILILLSFMSFSVILLLCEIFIYRISNQQWFRSFLNEDKVECGSKAKRLRKFLNLLK